MTTIRISLYLVFMLLLSSCASPIVNGGDREGEQETGDAPVDYSSWDSSRRAIEMQFYEFLDADAPPGLEPEDPTAILEQIMAKQGLAFDLRHELETYFENSDGDRDVFGWMMVRRAQTFLHLACEFALSPPHPDFSPDQEIMFRANAEAVGSQLAEVGLHHLDYGIDEGGSPWNDIASELKDILTQFPTAPGPTCQESRIFWHADDLIRLNDG